MSLSVHDSSFLEKNVRVPIRISRFSSGWNWSCVNQECPEYGLKGSINVVVAKIYGKRKIRLLRCRTCNSTFSERRFSPFYGSHADEQLILQALVLIAQGKSIRNAAKTLGVDKDTVCRWLDKAAQSPSHVKSFLEEEKVSESLVQGFVFSLEKRSSRKTEILSPAL
ncbi:MAG: helix-turn-helix domain-containing protein [Candidatus Eremiobacteraeota bacterium]|nr:helix-turn-helix domain-containing protein [Candidatus Eremiobacteraeota bacterium]MCL5054547.1 helix-turn-helix domain-containing protein [Bacillota bacterium]